VTVPIAAEKAGKYLAPDIIRDMIKDTEREMKEAAARLEFEKAAHLRDEIKALRKEELEIRTWSIE
jgi:excinuclease ABC subunit B